VSASATADRFVFPSEQREPIASACARDSLKLAEVLEERLEGAPLERRHSLRRAVELVQVGEAEVIVVAYFDRLVRSLTVQAEVAERVERAGGAILAVDLQELHAVQPALPR
jgi:DNA invertase Pin-like site-specific DNA recombinase